MVMVMVMCAWIDNDEASEATSESRIWHMRPCAQSTSKFGDSQYGRRKSGESARGRDVHKQARLREVARALSWAHVKCVARRRVYDKSLKSQGILPGEVGSRAVEACGTTTGASWMRFVGNRI